jgi:2-iminobutanoate/2-iminopropanoate deaminase
MTPSTEPKYYPYPDGAPFSEAVRVGDHLYLSGHIGDDDQGLVPAGLEAQTRQMMENVRASLLPHGLDLDAVFSCRIMLTDMSQWAAFNAVYVQYFKQGRMPVRATFGVAALALGALIEIECIAYAGGIQ